MLYDELFGNPSIRHLLSSYSVLRHIDKHQIQGVSKMGEITGVQGAYNLDKNAKHRSNANCNGRHEGKASEVEF